MGPKAFSEVTWDLTAPFFATFEYDESFAPWTTPPIRTIGFFLPGPDPPPGP
jgi:hypothetical protein